MKKLKLIILINLIIPITGCALFNNNFKDICPVSILIYKESELYYMDLLTLNNSILSSVNTENNIDLPLYETYTFKGKSLTEISENIKGITNKQINLSKVKSIIFHESILNNMDIFQEISNYLVNNSMYDPNIYLYSTKEDPQYFYNKENLTNNISLYYLLEPDMLASNQIVSPQTIINCNKSYLDNKRMFYIPNISINYDFNKSLNNEEKNQNQFYLNGAFFLEYKNTFKYIEQTNLSGYRWKRNNKDFTFELSSSQNIKVTKSSWKAYIRDNSLYLDVLIYVKVKNKIDELEINILEANIKNYINEDIMNTYSQNYQTIDIYHFHDLSYRKQKNVISYDTFNLNIEIYIENNIL